MHNHRKHGVGETIMQDGPIYSEDGHGGRSRISEPGGRHFSFSTDDIYHSPTARHYETKGHRYRYETEADIDAEEEAEQAEDPFQIEEPAAAAPEKKEKSKHKSSSKHHHRNHRNELTHESNPYERHRAY